MRVRRNPVASGDRFTCGRSALTIRPGAGEILELPSAAEPADVGDLLPLLDIALAHNLALQGGCLLHASAFSVSGLGLLAVGESQSGKSSLAAAALAVEPGLLADDMVVATLHEDREVRLWPHRRDLFLRTPSERLLPAEAALRLRQVDRGGDQRWCLSREACPEMFIERLTPGVVWKISLDRRLRASRIARLDQGQLFAALVAASSPLFLSPRYPRERNAMLPVLTWIAENASGYRVWIGRDLLTAPGSTLELLLEGAVHGPPASTRARAVHGGSRPARH